MINIFWMVNIFDDQQINYQELGRIMSEGSFKYQKYMIKSAPYGELQSAIQNLTKISPLNLSTQQAQETLRQYNQDHLALMRRDNKQSLYPLTSVSRDNSGNYLDQLNQKSYKINYLTRQLQQQEDIAVQLPQPVIELLKILSKKVNNYVEKYYREPFGSHVFMQLTEEEGLVVHVAFTAKNLQLTNYVTGEWNSQWVITKNNIEGKVAIRSHIFQSGNVQMSHDKTLKQQFKFSQDMQSNANQIIHLIESFQCQIQKSLGQIYEEMPNAFFKHLRRIIPVTKTKMIWNVNALKMNKNLLQNKK